MNHIFRVIKIIFFISGFAALIYQIAWQRMLFLAFGVDLESVTIIISVFMAGIGIGGYCGGRIADKFPKLMLLVFALVEFGIGIFGLFSPALIHWVRDLVLLSSVPIIAISNFLLLLFPTFLMGSTLPLLTSYLNQNYDNTGENIGWLYFTNTIGASVSCLMMGFVFFYFLTLYQVIYLAGIINIVIASIVLALHYKNVKKYPKINNGDISQ